jgi:spermidine synthase
VAWLFLLAYTCSGLAGLTYEVSWTRLLTLYIGHTTAAASAVVAAFLGGLAVGAGAGGRIASRLTPLQSLHAYIGLELAVALAAIVLPYELKALTPLLRWAYADGTPGLLFPAVRVFSCLVMVFAPAAALGATFPMAIRWFANDAENAARSSSALYVVNTIGAAVGALLAGFVLLPALGISGTTGVGIAASVIAAFSVWLVSRATPPKTYVKRKKEAGSFSRAKVAVQAPAWVAVVVVGLSGCAALIHEIAWTRILSLVLGPTTYAFAATLAAVITGVAVGSAAGATVVGRTRRPAAWLALTLAAAAITATWTYSIAGTRVPLLVAQQVAAASTSFDQLLRDGTMLTAALILPTAACLGAAFPLALAMVNDPSTPAAGRFGFVYAVNTVGAVSGSLATGFLLIPLLGLQPTLRIVSGLLIASAAIVIAWGALSRHARIAGALASAVAVAMTIVSPPWDRDLLASGVYMYAPYVPKDLDLATQLRAGHLLYYREGAAATVSVKRLTGTTSLAVDGKTDASNRGDMLTQRLIAHLPLLLHDDPKNVGIIGLGSGATVGAALSHPIARVDVIEISPEVVEASRYFAVENREALKDPRTNLIVGDGRSHLLFSKRQYDVIVSEPSNPWIAGVAALFTREFFEAARDRLAPGGIMCQWANAYNISDPDLRSIVATFRSVFPQGTVWLVGRDDVLLVAGVPAIDAKLENIQRHWARPGVAEDLATVSVRDPFSILSLFIGGPAELERYAKGAPLFTDDRMGLEFSAPREIHRRSSGENSEALAALLADQAGPAAIREAKVAVTAVQWRNRGGMMAKADVLSIAYDDYLDALRLDGTDDAALDGLVRTALVSHRGADALAWVKSLTGPNPATPRVLTAMSKLFVSIGASADALEAAKQASAMVPVSPEALEQLASVFADAGDATQLDDAVRRLHAVAPGRAATHYYAAVAQLLEGNPDQAVSLAQQAIAADPEYAPVYDLIGAAFTKLERTPEARAAFETSLGFDHHDSAAYTNLGLIALAAGNRTEAANYFAEALWLTPESKTAREGLARSR